MFRVATALQQIATELNGAVSKETKIVTINKTVIKLTNLNDHLSLQASECNANDIGKQRFELSEQLQDHRADVALLSETLLKPHDKFFIQNYHVSRADRFPGLKGKTAVCVRKGIPHTHVDHLPLSR
jgi:cell fate regulator YaaT (PSP1 superfamily)